MYCSRDKKRDVVFVHPDLGIGGAERLVVTMANVIQKELARNVVIYTSHRDANHCFPETINGQLDVHVHGDWLPRTLFGKCQVLCTFIRCLYISFILLTQTVLGLCKYNVIINDQVSFINPILRHSCKRLIFYCHYPDQLLVRDRRSRLKQVYRMVFDWLEEKTISNCDVLFVNSKFTRSVFRQTFPSLQCDLRVLYPPVESDAIEAFLLKVSKPTGTPPSDFSAKDFEDVEKLDSLVGGIKGEWLWSGSNSLNNKSMELKDSARRPYFLSINRYERKKQIELAIDAFKKVLKAYDKDVHGPHKPALVIAGGYDSAVTENVEYYKELVSLAAKESLADEVIFLRSISCHLNYRLMHTALALIYTPSNEHFGIVPCEAMAMGTLVVAKESGGPLESVLHNKTGFLCCEGDTEAFANSLLEILSMFAANRPQIENMQIACRTHANQNFSLSRFASDLRRFL